MSKTAQRPNRATKIAYWSDVQCIFYAVTMNAFVHHWALVILDILIPCAYTVLQFLAALNRANKIGYVGCEVAYELLAPQIKLATRRGCSLTTLKLGLKTLNALGLVKLEWATTPNQEIINGPYTHKIKGMRQLRCIILTRRALDLWDLRSGKRGSAVIPHFSHLLTQSDSDYSPKIDQVDKPTMIKPHSTKSDTSTVSCNSVKTKAEGRPTSPQAAVEHRASTPAQPATSPKLDSSTHADSVAPAPHQTIDRATSPPSKEKGKKQTSCQSKPALRGCSHTPPPLPKNAGNKTSWVVGRAYLLVELHRGLAKFTEREADAIYTRALREMSSAYPKNLPAMVGWHYWASRFALFSPERRRGHMLRDILPLLRSEYVPTPNEPQRFQSENTTTGVIDEISDPFFQRIWKKFVK